MDQQRAQVVAVVAVARNGVIGAGPDIPWHVPGDQARFRRLTLGHPLVMGRLTYDAIGRPLPGRTTLVVSRDPSFAPAGVEVHDDVDAALDRALQLDRELVVVAGGGQVYRAAWGRLDALEVTEVDAEPAGDVFFPAVDAGEWAETAREQHEGHAFVRFERRSTRARG
ncbi:dihydrofolate reductase [Friedmanniella luteola]|uniref:Dihydrofolate reductase n=1 Tax=Friedmanniella luteola TaxID=546871 RepID=A0A1H1Y9K8_9ACTN|nr:dihydrofolate reductase [Friedmanniella luteola]SDT18133.1 dihydrofolate reductase [Friedmanniella luteola]